MLTVAVTLYLVVAVGVLAMAAKFGLGPVPAPHHAAAIAQDGVSMTPKLLKVFTAIYQAWGGAYFAVAILIAYLAIDPIRSGSSAAALAAGAAAVVAGAPAAYRARQVAVAANVNTPWQIAAALTALAVLATILALASN